MATNGELYDLWYDCDRLFHRTTESRTTRSYAVLEVLYQRFDQWAAYLGVFADHNISLDTRLMYSESLRNLVNQLLQIAKRNLKRIESLERECSDSETSESIIDQMSSPAKESVSSILVESLQALESAVHGLYRLGIAIRKSPSDNLNQRIQKFIDRTDDGVLRKLAFIHIKHRLVDRFTTGEAGRTREQGNNQRAGAALSLCEQLAMSVSFRYFRIQYRHNHAQKLAQRRDNKRDVSAIEMEAQSTANPRDDARDGIARNTGRTPTGVPPSVANRLKMGVPSISAPTKPDSNEAKQKYAASNPSFPKTAPSVSVKLNDFKYPKPPESDNSPKEAGAPSEREARCPYCWRYFPKRRYKDHKWWINHVNDDIKPWTCISEECIEPPQLFGEFGEWKQHMETQHSAKWMQKVHVATSWCCDMGHKEDFYDDEGIFEDHVRIHHPKYSMGSEMAAFKDLCEVRLPRPSDECPICNGVPEGLDSSNAYESLLHHVSTHLKEIGFMSLDYFEVDEEEESRLSRNTSGGEKNNMRGLPSGAWMNGQWIPDDPQSSSDMAFDYRDDEFAPAPTQLETELDWTFLLNSVSLQDLFREVSINLKMSAFDKKLFLPQDSFDRIFSEENIDSALSASQPEILNFIKHKAKRVFAVVLHVNMQPKMNILKIMESFQNNGFDDGDLLLHEDPRCQRLEDPECSHPASFDLFHDEELWYTPGSIRRFFHERWIFLAPVFSRTHFNHTLSSKAILPFEWVDEGDSEDPIGGFRKVKHATIHPSHQKVLSTDGPALDVAIKELQQSANPNNPPPAVAWELELHRPNSHEHLISAIGAFQRRNKYYLVFQWADGGTLQSFWEENKKPSISPDFIEDTLQQLVGLADALSYMHRESRSPIYTGGSSDHWRRGDITPENISRIRRTDQTMDLGTLHIADLGLAVRHTLATQDSKATTGMEYGTLKYKGPEAHPLVEGLNAQSHRYDVWSMGCIILEFIIWMLYGREGLGHFHSEPLDPDGTETNFYKVEVGGHMEVGKIAKRWMNEIKEDPELNGETKPTALRELLDLVEKGLLVVTTYERGESDGTEGTESPCRATAEGLKQKLERMVEKGKSDRGYLLTGSERKSTRALPASLCNHIPTPAVEASSDAEADWDLDLASLINLSMIKSADDHRDFLPETQLAQLVTGDSVKSEIGDSPRLVEFILDQAPKVFALVLSLGITRTAEELRSVMEDFRLNQFDDKVLPVIVSIGLGITGHPDIPGEEGYRKCKAARHAYCDHDDLLYLNAFHHRLWSPRTIRRFYRDQWQYRAPVFEKGKLRHQLFPDDVLPFTEVSSSPRDGSFSRVSQVKIHSDHQRVLEEVEGHERSFAIKELKALDWPGYDPEEAWKVEADSLQDLSMLNNKHLITLIAAYTRRRKYCFIFEWAEGGTMRDYWRDKPNPELNPDLIRTILEQLRGLAGAIFDMHHAGKKSNSTDGNDNTESNWRHGDLKPDNILRFLDHPPDRSQLGILRIADLGLAKNHKFQTTDRDNPTDRRLGTSQYGPPEAFTHPLAPRSRLYDIWSMGCIIFEFTIWLLYGLPGLEKFLNEECVYTPQSTLYFEGRDMLSGPEAQLNDMGVQKWMEHILPHDSECKETKECENHEDCNNDNHAELGTAIGDLLRLVRTRLLVINLPGTVKGAPHRGDAKVLVDELEKILRRAQKNENYALSVARRSGMKPPEPATSQPESTQI